MDYNNILRVWVVDPLDYFFGGYSLHSYMNLRPVKNNELKTNHSLLFS